MEKYILDIFNMGFITIWEMLDQLAEKMPEEASKIEKGRIQVVGTEEYHELMNKITAMFLDNQNIREVLDSIE